MVAAQIQPPRSYYVAAPRVDNSGKYQPENNGRYRPDNDGKYTPTGSLLFPYRPDIDSKYTPTGSLLVPYRPDTARVDDGRYHPEDDGKYRPDDAGRYSPTKDIILPYRPEKSAVRPTLPPTRVSPLPPTRASPLPALPALPIIREPSVLNSDQNWYGPDGKSTLGIPVGLVQSNAAGLYENRNYAIIQQDYGLRPDGYQYRYETENGIYGQEEGIVNEGTNAEGYYKYTGPDSILYEVSYKAGIDGFLPIGAHIPTPPPIPPLILKALQWQAAQDAQTQKS